MRNLLLIAVIILSAMIVLAEDPVCVEADDTLCVDADDTLCIEADDTLFVEAADSVDFDMQEETKRISNPVDTTFLWDKVSELPQLDVKTKRKRLLHILAYVREYSTMTTINDTVFLFREKMVDYMYNPDKNLRFKGWSNPRTLKSRSYYRFSDCEGLDSVSDVCDHHFSWSDWIGVNPGARLPARLSKPTVGCDTVHARFVPSELWKRDRDRVSVGVDVLADTLNCRWVPDISWFFHRDIDFYEMKVNLEYDNVLADTLTPGELTGYSFYIESNGRGREMFRFGEGNVPYYVKTDVNVYILDKDYITVKEAKKWKNWKIDEEEIDIYEPAGTPEVSHDILALIERVEKIDKAGIIIDNVPDQRMVSKHFGHRGRNFTFGRRALHALKGAVGISSYKGRRNLNRGWDQFRKEQNYKNSLRGIGD